MLKVYQLFLWIALASFFACTTKEDPAVDPCDDNDWARVMRNGTEICFEQMAISYWQANTSNAYITAEIYNDRIDAGATAPYILADFSIPASGIELHKPYPLKEGTFYDVEELTSGEITFYTFENQNSNSSESMCISGVFSLTSKNPNSGATTTFSNGKFLQFAVRTGGSTRNECSPF